MAVRSQNGWPLLTEARQTVTFTAGGRQWRAATPVVALVAGAFLEAYARTVEPITGGQLDDWSWAQRPVRGSTTVPSNHWSATAWDVNALRHPRGKPANLNTEQTRALRRLLTLFAPAIKWGGDFKTTVDPMHLELAVGPAALDQWAREHVDLLTSARTGRPAPAATPAAPPVSEDDLDMDAATLQTLVRQVLFEDKTLDKLAEAVWTRRRVGTPHPVNGKQGLSDLETLLGRAASVIPDGIKAGMLYDTNALAAAVLTHPIDDARGQWPLADRVAGIDRAVNAPMRSAVEGVDDLVAPREMWRQSDARLRVTLQALGATQTTIKQLVSLLGQVHGVDTAAVIASVNQAIVDAVVRVDDAVEETTAAPAPAAAAGSAA